MKRYTVGLTVEVPEDLGSLPAGRIGHSAREEGR